MKYIVTYDCYKKIYLGELEGKDEYDGGWVSCTKFFKTKTSLSSWLKSSLKSFDYKNINVYSKINIKDAI
jgi:hypothetical protein